MVRAFMVAMWSLGAAMAPATSVEIEYSDPADYGFNDPTLGADRRAALEYAARNWAFRINSPIAIKIEASFQDQGGTPTSAPLALGGPAAFYDDAGILYPDALQDYRTGFDNDPTVDGDFNPDIIIIVNDRIDQGTVLGGNTFYYGLDENTPLNTVSFVRVALHELAHGLGFYSMFNATGGYDNGLDLPTIYDTFAAEGAIAQTSLVSMTTGQRAAAVVGDNIFFVGAKTVADFGGLPRLYAPGPIFQDGASLSHFRLGSFIPAELMEPALLGSSFNVGFTDSVLEDLGYSLNYPPTFGYDPLTPPVLTIPEGASELLEIEFSAPAPMGGSFAYSIVPTVGSPEEGADFTITPSGTASFLAGETAVFLTVDALADSEVEGDEAFELRLSAPLGLEFGPGSERIRTIVIPAPTGAAATGWEHYQ